MKTKRVAQGKRSATTLWETEQVRIHLELGDSLDQEADQGIPRPSCKLVGNRLDRIS